MRTNRIEVGARFKLSEIGKIRCPDLADKVGVVVALGQRTTGITVLFDGAQRPTVLHRDYIRPSSDED
ncbi:hypothetical protein BD122_21491 [Bradyrhizobium diazoefficiens]|nr:hypothetical protein BD122_21491 [Bradyrhizobium diazoefficiens]